MIHYLLTVFVHVLNQSLPIIITHARKHLLILSKVAFERDRLFSVKRSFRGPACPVRFGIDTANYQTVSNHRQYQVYTPCFQPNCNGRYLLVVL